MSSLLGARDPAQPLLTLLTPDGRVELSGSTTANWVAKSANLLADGLGRPDRVGLLLPLHWQTVTLLLAGAATGATVVLASDADGLAGCGVAFVAADAAPAALDAGVEDVYALSLHPMGAPLREVPPLALDLAREVPSYGDRFSGPDPGPARLEVDGRELAAPPPLPVGPADRVLLTLDPATREGLVGLLGVLAAGAALVLVPDPAALASVAAEGITATLGVDVGGVPRLR